MSLNANGAMSLLKMHQKMNLFNVSEILLDFLRHGSVPPKTEYILFLSDTSAHVGNAAKIIDAFKEYDTEVLMLGMAGDVIDEEEQDKYLR